MMFNRLRHCLGSRDRVWPLAAIVAVVLGLALPVQGIAASPASSAAAGPDRIIISGAAGHLGELTVQALLARGVAANRLILVSRTPDTLARYARLGASVRYGDFTRPASLRQAFAGGNRMLLISIGFGSMPRPQAHENAIAAAVADGVKHIVYTSWVGLSRGDRSGIGADHYATEQILKRSGVAWTMLRNSVYMEELLPAAQKMLATGRVTAPLNAAPIGYVARADCAAAAAAALATPGHDDKVYDITGSQLIGTRELAAAVSAVTGRIIAVTAPAQTVPVESAPNTGPASASARAGAGAPSANALGIVSKDVAALTGRPPMTLEAFLRQHEAQIRGPGR